MKSVLICPSERSGVALLWRSRPLAIVPLLGESLLEYWLSAVSASGAKEVLILAHDRPEQVQAIAGDGARWGITVSVIAESRELTPAQALLKYVPETGPVAGQSTIALLDHFPAQEHFPLFDSYASLFAALRGWLPAALTPDRVGYRQVRPGIWSSTCASISPKAQLQAPCWIGHHASIGAGAVIGPWAIIEDEVIVEAGAEITESRIGCSTFVGKWARIKDSMTLGNTLVNWRNGSSVEVPDPFLVCSLREPRPAGQEGWFGKLAEAVARGKEESSLLWKHLALHKEG